MKCEHCDESYATSWFFGEKKARLLCSGCAQEIGCLIIDCWCFIREESPVFSNKDGDGEEAFYRYLRSRQNSF